VHNLHLATMTDLDPSLDPIRRAELQDFYANHKAKFSEIWKLTQRPAHRSLFGALSMDDLALRLNDIVAPSRIRYSPSAFKEKQKDYAASGLPTSHANSYFDAAKQGIEAAKVAADNLEIFIASMLALDTRHAREVMEIVALQAEKSNIRVPGRLDLVQFIRKTQWTVRAWRIAMTIATRQSMKPQGKGRPASIYSPLAEDLGELWEQLTGKKVVTPGGQKKVVTSKNGQKLVTQKDQKKTSKKPRRESSEISNQFIWLAMQMVVPNLGLPQAETAIRNAIPALRLRSEVISSEELTKVLRREDVSRSLPLINKFFGVEDNWTESDD
jgi:hypothetical protein